MPAEVFTLEQLVAELDKRFGKDFDIIQNNQRDGRGFALLSMNGRPLAAWRSRLINPPVYDGVTPRGPAEYHDFRVLERSG